MGARDAVTVDAMMRRVEARLRRVLAAREATLEMRLDATGDLDAPHLEEAVQLVVLVLAEHARESGTFTLTAAEKEGGDVEISVDGLDLPDAFPDAARHEDLWRLAADLLVTYHRSRIADMPDRVLILVPHGARAAKLRERRARG